MQRLSDGITDENFTVLDAGFLKTSQGGHVLKASCCHLDYM